MSIGEVCQFILGLKRAITIPLVFLILLGACLSEQEDLSVATLRSQTGHFSYETVPSFALEDMNPSSPFYEELKSAEDFRAQVTAWYFTHATCSYCRSQYVLLDQMQAEFDEDDLAVSVQILAINAPDLEAGLIDMGGEGDLPLLQDTETVGLWEAWEATYRDVVVVNPDLVPIAIFNLTKHDLAEENYYASLKDLIIDVVDNPGP